MPPTATTTSTHNANGNQVTHTLTYDAENRLVSVKGSGLARTPPIPAFPL